VSHSCLITERKKKKMSSLLRKSQRKDEGFRQEREVKKKKGRVDFLSLQHDEKNCRADVAIGREREKKRKGKAGVSGGNRNEPRWT